jgi:hypothetical protein
VDVESAPAPAPQGLPGRAPGTVRWMVAFTVLYAAVGRIPRADLDLPFDT